MLVLSRKKGEEIVVPGANIRIIVLDAKGTRDMSDERRATRERNTAETQIKVTVRGIAHGAVEFEQEIDNLFVE